MLQTIKSTFGRGQALHFGMAAKMQGMTPTVDPASPAHQLEIRNTTQNLRSLATNLAGCRIRSGSETCDIGIDFVRPIIRTLQKMPALIIFFKSMASMCASHFAPVRPPCYMIESAKKYLLIYKPNSRVRSSYY